MDNFWTESLVEEWVKVASNKLADPNTHGGWLGYEKEKEKFKKSKQKTCEILSFKSDYAGVKDVIFSRDGDKGFVPDLTRAYVDGVYSEDYMLKQPTAKIHSVKRLSDGEVFSLGDYCFHGPIKGFTLKEWGIMADFSHGDVGCGIRLDDLKKARKFLFTTEDGKTIYEGDKYCKVNSHSDFSIVTGFEAHGNQDGYNGLKFSTREAAEEYIIMNRPVGITAKEVLEIFDNEDFEDAAKKLKKLVKSKL